MIREIENRRSIRKYKPDEIERKLIEEIIYSASLAPSAKNRQPWKFIATRLPPPPKSAIMEPLGQGPNKREGHSAGSGATNPPPAA